MPRILLALALMTAPCLPACGGDHDDASGGDGDADADSDGDGDGDGNACALAGDAGHVQLDLLVDGLEVLDCVDGRWRLNIRLCGDAASPACRLVSGGACSEDVQARLVGDGCDSQNIVVPTAGHFTVCVEAELVNGFYAAEQCTDIDVGPDGIADPVPIDIDTDGTFPCVRDWWYDPEENQCCTRNASGGFCAPVDY